MRICIIPLSSLFQNELEKTNYGDTKDYSRFFLNTNIYSYNGFVHIVWWYAKQEQKLY